MRGRLCLFLFLEGCSCGLYALDPGKALTQYSRAFWNQQDGLPEDTIRAITQTTDGFLWLGTDEGLARFDGYEFVNFGKDQGELPSNSVLALAAGKDGSLWIGTSNGLTRYQHQRFHTMTRKDGLPGNVVSALFVDHAGTLWVVAGGSLSRFDGSHFTSFLRDRDLPMHSVRSVTEDKRHILYAAGINSVARFENGRFLNVFGPSTLEGDFPGQILADDRDKLWVLGVRGLIERHPGGEIAHYGTREGLSDSFGLNAITADRDGNIWVGTDGGLARLEAGSFRTLAAGPAGDGVRCLFEDREGNLWVGANRGLLRFRDDMFTVFGKTEGLPSDAPNVIYQDHRGKIWAGFLDSGMATFPTGDPFHSVAAGTGRGRVYSIRETHEGRLLVAGREGLAVWNNGVASTFVPPDPQGRKRVYDALEDSAGRIWLALPNGLGELRGNKLKTVIPAASPVMLESSFVTLAEGNDGSLWAGTMRGGLWHVTSAGNRLYTTADGLGSDQIRSLYQAKDGTLWIGTLGGGLNAFQGGRFLRFTAKDGLLSDNISNVLDDGNALWLSTTRGICRISKKQLRDFSGRGVKRLNPENYGLDDGLRSAQSSPEIGGGGVRLLDGSLWFVTARGIAVIRPGMPKRAKLPPPIYLVDVRGGGRRLDWSGGLRIQPGLDRIDIRYAAIYLSAPERVRYSYKLDGLDTEWMAADGRRLVTYNGLGRGSYRFRVRAALPEGPSAEASFAFDLLPHYYESGWFRVLCAAAAIGIGWMAYQFRVRQIRSRFAVILKERLRLAREIHDTLAQAFVGISAQLDAIETCLQEDLRSAHVYLDVARRMAQHSLTEARRSVMDLRSAALNDHGLPAALQSGARTWAEGSPVDIDIAVTGDLRNLPEEVEQNLLRIAQEAVTNAQKHANASRITVTLHAKEKTLILNVNDDGCGFESEDAFLGMGGHFGLIGIRERAERIGGELQLESRPGQGTHIEVTVPLP